MSRIIIAATTLVIFACQANAQTVVTNTNILSPSPYPLTGYNASFLVWQDAARTDFTSVYFKLSGTVVNGVTVSGVAVNLDQGSNWYLVHAGDVFSPSKIAAGAFPVIVENFTDHTPLQLTNHAEDFYLGVNTGSAYGWVHLQPADVLSTVTMLGNAMSYNSPGIIVGTTTLVPEPSSVSLGVLLTACVSITRQRRRK